MKQMFIGMVIVDFKIYPNFIFTLILYLVFKLWLHIIFYTFII